MDTDARRISQAAYVIGMAAGAFIEAMGMVAENEACKQRGDSLAYGQRAFDELMTSRGLHHNALVNALSV